MSKKAILLVEDEIIIAMDEAAVLENNGYKVILVCSGSEAIAFVKQDEQIDLILMDINLGDDVDGTEAAGIILEEADIPLIFMSSHTEKEIVEKTEGITSYGYIVKNSGETVMLTSIKMAFRLYEAKLNVKKAKDVLNNANIDWTSTFNSINDSIALLDLDNNIVNCNTAFCSFIDMEKNDIIGQKCMNLIHKTKSHHAQCPFKRMLKSGKREKMELQIGDKYFDVIVDPIFDTDGKITRVVHIFSDITEYKKIEEILQMRIMNLTQPAYGNEEICFEDLFDLEEIQKLQDDFANATGTGALITLPDGTPVTRQSNFSRLCSEVIRGTEKGYQNCMYSDAYIGKYLTTGPCMKKCLSGGLYDAGAGISVGGKHIANWLIGQVRDSEMTEEHIVDYAREIGADPVDAVKAFHEIKPIDKDQFKKIAALLYTTANTLSQVAFQNLKQARMLETLKKNEDEIKKLLTEKDLLLKEVHHRIKNNMASIESLLSLQISEIHSPEAVSALQDAALRVNSLRILYDKLLNTDSYTDLPIKVFIDDVVDGIKRVFPQKTGIEIKFDVEDIRINSKSLFPFGLIINELLTNVYKHAFENLDLGQIDFKLNKSGNELFMEISDNGKGLPEDFNLESSQSFGLKLAGMLAEQLHGEFTIGNHPSPEKSTVCRIKLAADL